MLDWSNQYVDEYLKDHDARPPRVRVGLEVRASQVFSLLHSAGLAGNLPGRIDLISRAQKAKLLHMADVLYYTGEKYSDPGPSALRKALYEQATSAPEAARSCPLPPPPAPETLEPIAEGDRL